MLVHPLARALIVSNPGSMGDPMRCRSCGNIFRKQRNNPGWNNVYSFDQPKESSIRMQVFSLLNIQRWARHMKLMALVSFVLLGAGLGAQQPSPAAPAPEGQNPEGYHAPTLTVTTRIVVLDVIVTDKKGNPVHRNLTRDDFKIYEDKQPQQIRSFDPPDQHGMPKPGQAIVHSAADLAKIGNAPVTILVLDELNSEFMDMAYARQMLVKYLKSQPAVLPEPAVLMVASNMSFEQIHDYTQSRDELIEAVKKHRPELPWRMMTTGRSGPGALDRMARVLNSLQQISKASTGTPGRKNLIWVGVGFPTVDLEPMDPDDADMFKAAIRRCTTQLMNARVTLYTINPASNTSTTLSTAIPVDDEYAGMASDPGDDPLFAGDTSFASLAPATGGLAFAGRNDINNLIGEDIDKGQDYYTLSYTPTSQSTDAAKFRKIRVVMKDPNLRAVTREGYYAMPGSGEDPTLDKKMEEKLAHGSLLLDLASALTTTMTYNGLDVSAVRKSADQWEIEIAENNIDWSAPDPKGGQHTEDTLAFAWFNAKGKLLGHATKEEIAGRMNPSQGARYKLTISLPPRAVRLRIVVRDALSGRMGTVDVTKL